MTPAQHRLVIIEWCYDCPHNDKIACSAKRRTCKLSKKRISGINCTPFPKTCPLPRPHIPALAPNLHTCIHKEIRNGVEFCHFNDSPTDPAAIRNATISELYDRIKAERDPSLEYVDWDSIEAVFIRTREAEKRMGP